jgi:DnaJ-class molecular chaperone
MYNDGNDGLYGGKNGNLLIKVNIKYDDDSKYQRKGSIDIISDEEIQYYDAILGINKEVDTIHGKLLINIPSGSQHGTQIKINNYGIRIPETKQGDAYINLKIKIPVNVSEEEMTLLTAIQSHRTSIDL